jgi:CDP-glucose 4,6-dehydratase
MNLFGGIYKGKKVLITGNTGFKGSWLSIWLLELGAEVYGISDKIISKPSNFVASKLEEKINHFYCDITNFDKINAIITEVKPDFIFHLAAQAIVKDSYSNPLNAFSINTLGSATILEVLRINNIDCNVIMITSDKCYENKEWMWGYRETDQIGGKDPYSASKGAAEIIIKSYCDSFFCDESSKTKVAIGRAGNVIGGGDWAPYRIIPDAIKSWNLSEDLLIRYPNATRPWQHVLEPLSGYLLLGQKLYLNKNLCGEAFNFGPKSDANFSVIELLESIKKNFTMLSWRIIDSEVKLKESGLLKLNCDKSLHMLGWNSILNFEQTVRFVSNWYEKYYSNINFDMYQISLNDINEFINLGIKQNVEWIQNKT